MEEIADRDKFVRMISECLDNNSFQHAEILREKLYHADMMATHEIYLTGKMIQEKKSRQNNPVYPDITKEKISTYIQIILANQPVLNYPGKEDLQTAKIDSTQFLWCWFHFFNSLSTEEMSAFIQCFHEEHSTELKLLNNATRPNDKLFFVNRGSVITVKKEQAEFNILKIYEKGTIGGYEPFFLSSLYDNDISEKNMFYDNKVHYIANENTHIHYVVKSELNDIVNRYPDIGHKLSDFCLSYNGDFPQIGEKQLNSI